MKMHKFPSLKIPTQKPFFKYLIKYFIRPDFPIFRLPTSPIRLNPNFIIIGGQKCGTTSLYNYLTQHPCIYPAIYKEAHFFDNYYSSFKLGIHWYKAQFPSIVYQYYCKKVKKLEIITGEATPYYIFHPLAPKRVQKLIPNVKLIAILRNPVDRAYSHYYHSVKRGYETLSFEDAIEKEKKRLKDEKFSNYNHQHYSYLSRGIYVEQLKNWLALFPKKQLLIVKSEDLFIDPPSIYNKVIEFLELPKHELREYKKFNLGSYHKMDVCLRKKLIDYYKPYNEKLYEYVNINFDWQC
jgi:hypothetical protein